MTTCGLVLPSAARSVGVSSDSDISLSISMLQYWTSKSETRLLFGFQWQLLTKLLTGSSNRCVHWHSSTVCDEAGFSLSPLGPGLQRLEWAPSHAPVRSVALHPVLWTQTILGIDSGIFTVISTWPVTFDPTLSVSEDYLAHPLLHHHLILTRW